VTAERAPGRRRAGAAREGLAAATERINESDARITGAAERLARLNKELHTLANQREHRRRAAQELAEVLERDRAALSELNSRGPEARSRTSTRAPTPPRSSSTRRSSWPASASSRPGSGSSAPPSRSGTSSCRRRAASRGRGGRAALAEAARRRELRRQGIERCGELALVARDAGRGARPGGPGRGRRPRPAAAEVGRRRGAAWRP
jgi:chromosome segregation protein